MGSTTLKKKVELHYRQGHKGCWCDECEHFVARFEVHSCEAFGGPDRILRIEPRCKIIGLGNSIRYRVRATCCCDAYAKKTGRSRYRTMKAISLWQPWATLVALKLKTIETRTHDRFRSLVGQRIAIHAARKWKEDGLSVTRLAENGRVGHGISLMLSWQNISILAQRCRGKIVCTAVIKKVEWAWACAESRTELEGRALCDVEEKFLLFLDDVQPLKEPRWFKGRQGIFEVPDVLILQPATSNGPQAKSASGASL